MSQQTTNTDKAGVRYVDAHEVLSRISADHVLGSVITIRGIAEKDDMVYAEHKVRMALDKYPPALVSKILKTVAIVQSIEYQNVPVSGLAGDNYIVVSISECMGPGLDTEAVADVVHHELSSIILREHPELFDANRFVSCNTESFLYPDWSYVKNHLSDYDTSPSDEWARKGFVSGYSTTSVENDFNTIAEYLFPESDESLAAFVGKSDVLRCKFRCVMDMYGARFLQYGGSYKRVRGI